MSFNTRFKPVPNTECQLWINIHGEVWDVNGNYVTPETALSEAKIHWVGKDTKVPVSLLVVITFLITNIPDLDWNNVKPLYKNGNTHDSSLGNLFYRFIEPIEHQGHPGFYYIPYFTDYCINETGNVINAVTGKVKSWHTTRGGHKNATGGYRYTRVVTGDYTTNLGRHRALCLTFKHYAVDPSTLLVNHRNGVPGDDWLDNLQWSNHAENNQHAYDQGLRPNSSKPVLMKNLRTGDIQRFETTVSCARHLGYDTGTVIWWRLNKSPTKVFPDMLQFKWDDGSEWPDVI